MITKFQIFENIDIKDIDINIDLKKEYLDMLIDNLSIRIFKIKTKIKYLRIKSINGDNNKNDIIININMSNSDKIKGQFNKLKKIITISINDNIIYDVDYKKFNINDLLNKIISEYKKYLKENRWKIK